MRRKLVKQGAATMMISLPAKWIKKFGLVKGDEIDLEEQDSKLLVSPKEQKIKSETTIKLTDFTESSVRTLITNTYRTGYDRIRVEFDNEKQFKLLNSIIKTRLIGFEVIKKQKNSCVVENITEPSAEQFDNILKKIFLNISALFEITKNRMKNKEETENFEEIEERIQKYDNFCRRVIMKKGIENKKSEMFWAFLTLIIHGQRELYHLNKLLDRKLNISVKTLELLEDSREIFDLIQKAYEGKNPRLLSQVHKLEKDLIYKKGYSALKKEKTSIILYHILSTIRNFYLASSPLMGILISQEV